MNKALVDGGAGTGPGATRRLRRLVVVSAGLSRPSSTRLLADRLTAAVTRLAGSEVEVEVRVIELRDLGGEVAQNLVTGFPPPRLREAVDAVTSADGLIAVTPVFTGSYSGLFKSFFDVIDKDALAGTPVLAAATGGTARHSLMLDHAMRPLFTYLRAVVVPTGVYAASEDWGTAGDDTLAARIDRAAAELVALLDGRPARPRPAAAVAGETVTGAAATGGAATGEDGTGEAATEAADDDVVPFAEQLAALAVEP